MPTTIFYKLFRLTNNTSFLGLRKWAGQKEASKKATLFLTDHTRKFAAHKHGCLLSSMSVASKFWWYPIWKS
jgi:hypothetical protein